MPIFSIFERGGNVNVEMVKNVSSDILLGLVIKKVKRGSLIYTDCFKSYAGLVSYGFKHERINKGRAFSNGKVYINRIEGFCSYAKQGLLKYNGVSKLDFIYYLKDYLKMLEFRYNDRDKNIFLILLDSYKAKSSILNNRRLPYSIMIKKGFITKNNF